MAFDSFSAFLAMEGHGPYVWACYGAFVLLMATLMVWSLRRRKAAFDACRRGFEETRNTGRTAASGAQATFARVNVSQD
ncbi:MAG: heme exporter protein CcmD [Gammaproteobacteria bacterium]|uniref:heme exporter protein CcmD n=1 Tax=Marinobacter nitratireducens TaxID=1137280 RepID=UPI00056585B7|nr:heme exporter protein CcmD [Marinobacter nitratireducens]TNE73578.1 MAG: heme exporter protein CcmD [Gammaproteobacteria bacterium]